MVNNNYDYVHKIQLSKQVHRECQILLCSIHGIFRWCVKKKEVDKSMFDKDLLPSQESKIESYYDWKRTVEDIVTLLSDARVLPQTP